METRSVELSIPADPANLDSEAKVRVTECVYIFKNEQAHNRFTDTFVLIPLSFVFILYLAHPTGRTGVVPRFCFQNCSGH